MLRSVAVIAGVAPDGAVIPTQGWCVFGPFVRGTLLRSVTLVYQGGISVVCGIAMFSRPPRSVGEFAGGEHFLTSVLSESGSPVFEWPDSSGTPSMSGGRDIVIPLCHRVSSRRPYLAVQVTDGGLGSINLFFACVDFSVSKEVDDDEAPVPVSAASSPSVGLLPAPVGKSAVSVGRPSEVVGTGRCKEWPCHR